MIGLLIQPARSENSRAIAEVHVESWQQAYKGLLSARYLAALSVPEREAIWRGMAERDPAHLLLAHVNGRVVGFVAFGASRDEDAPAQCAEIMAIYVKPDAWSTGAGRELWRSALRRIVEEGYRTVSLWVIAGNARAIRFYEKAGFVAEPASRKTFEIDGAAIDEVRYRYDPAG